MKSFAFRLDRVLELRKKQLGLEEAQFRQASATLALIDRTRAELQAGAARIEDDVRRRSCIAGEDLSALAEYRGHARMEAQRLSIRRIESARDLAARESAMLEARRKCRLLERLRERKLGEWRASAEREVEATTSESYLAQWGSAEGRTL